MADATVTVTHLDGNDPAAEEILALFDRQEQKHWLPYGSVLNLGCSSSIWSFYLCCVVKKAWRYRR